MQVPCKKCQTPFELATENLPKDKEVWLVCPACHDSFPLPRKWWNGAALEAGLPSTGVEPSTTSEAVDELNPYEVVEEGVETALLIATNPEHTQQLERALKNLNYHVSMAPTAKMALTKLRHNDYNVFILDESFDGARQEKDILLQYIQMPNHARRQRFFCFVSEQVASLDQLAAFGYCANLVVNVKDLGKAETILKRAISDYKSFYKVFWQEMKELRKV